MHIICMSKVISLSDQAYLALSALKKSGESFSDTVLAITKERQQEILSFAGKWQGPPKEADRIFAEIHKNRSSSRARDVKF